MVPVTIVWKNAILSFDAPVVLETILQLIGICLIVSVRVHDLKS